jgi:hypothetical protein
MAKVRAFRCSRTGLYYPSDYVEEWGRKYGIGLGCVPISEAITTRYDMPVCEAKDSNKTMHPLGVCRSQVDLVEIEEEEYLNNQAVLAIEDEDMSSRASIMRDKQLQKSAKLMSMFPGHVEDARLRIDARATIGTKKLAAKV